MAKMALSHSRLSDFQQCPLKFKLKYMDKAENFQMKQEDKSIHLVRGDNIHKALENYLIKRKSGENDVGASSLPEVEQTKPLIEKLVGLFGIDNVHPEAQVSINDAWKQVDWFDRESYYRAIFDLICLSDDVAMIGDYKTGKFRDYAPASGKGQLELASAIALSLWPVKEVKTMYIYVDHKKTIQKTYTQDNRIELVDYFNSQHEAVNTEANFDPKANDFCKWCEATKAQCPKSRKL